MPSRVHKGKMYALPQSPQVFKQLIMIGGMDRYFQIARCLRDEDLRADRQPEFTQLDLELSFGDEEDVYAIIETAVRDTIKASMGRDVETPFPRITHAEAMERYGLDKPDLRNSGSSSRTSARSSRGAASASSTRCWSRAVGSSCDSRRRRSESTLTRKVIESELTEFVKGFGAKGLAYLVRCDEEGKLAGPIAKFVDDEAAEARSPRGPGSHAGDALLIVADKPGVVFRSLGELRNELARRLDLIPADGALRFVWVVDFPMFEWSEDDQRYVTTHHPFTTPLERYEGQLEKEPEGVAARAYDLVLNGWELGSGSVRIHDRELQQRVFVSLGITEEEAKSKFGFFLEAFEYGAPPHAGIALGLERLLALLLGKPNIRDLVAFPKTASATCLMTRAPGEVPPETLADLGLSIVEQPRPPSA